MRIFSNGSLNLALANKNENKIIIIMLQTLIFNNILPHVQDSELSIKGPHGNAFKLFSYFEESIH